MREDVTEVMSSFIGWDFVELCLSRHLIHSGCRQSRPSSCAYQADLQWIPSRLAAHTKRLCQLTAVLDSLGMWLAERMVPGSVPGPCLINATWRRHRPFSQWQHSFQMKPVLPLAKRLESIMARDQCKWNVCNSIADTVENIHLLH